MLESSCINIDDINKLYVLMGVTSSINLAILFILLQYKNYILIVITHAALGFWLSPNLVVWYWYSVEIAFPLKETTFSSVFLIIADILGFAFSFGFNDIMLSILNYTKASLVMIIYWILMWFLGIIISCSMKRINHRNIDNLRHIVSVAFDES